MGWDPTHVRFYSPRSFKKIIQKSGLIVGKWASTYIVPYDILSWMLLKKIEIPLPMLRFVDYGLGKVFPFNKLGWAIIVVCRKP